MGTDKELDTCAMHLVFKTLNFNSLIDGQTWTVGRLLALNNYVKLIKHPLNAFPSTIPFPNYYYLLTDSFVLLFTGNYDQMNLQHACM